MNRGLTVSVQRSRSAGVAPGKADLARWARAAWRRAGAAEVSLRLVGESESGRLNRQYRHKNGPTNVLSFPLGVPEEYGGLVLGDLVICAPVVRAEAHAQGKLPKAHWAHMVVHGMLHLQGHDHEEAAQAEAMEELERDILAELGYADPY